MQYLKKLNWANYINRANWAKLCSMCPAVCESTTSEPRKTQLPYQVYPKDDFLPRAIDPKHSSKKVHSVYPKDDFLPRPIDPRDSSKIPRAMSQYPSKKRVGAGKRVATRPVGNDIQRKGELDHNNYLPNKVKTKKECNEHIPFKFDIFTFKKKDMSKKKDIFNKKVTNNSTKSCLLNQIQQMLRSWKKI